MKLLRIGILALLAFSVLAFGGVEDWARAVFESGTAVLFLFWAVAWSRRPGARLFLSSLAPPLAALCALVFLQGIFHLSVSPFATRIEFQLLLADAIFLFLASQAFRTAGDWKAFFWFVMSFGFAVSLFGILQHLTFNGKLYWFRELRFGGIPFGPYVNRNHFAGFAELVIPLALVPLVLGKIRRERRLLVAVFLVVQIGALLLSASRGGIISLSCQAALLLLWLIAKRVRTLQLLLAAGIAALALSLVYWLGAGQILQRFSAMHSLEITAGKRASMRRDTFRIFLDHPVVGTGLGTLQIVFPRYETNYDGRVVNHAHNDYLEALAETGFLGAVSCAWFLFALFRGYLRRSRDSASASFPAALNFAGILSCAGFLIHSLVDFNLHIPANAALFFLMASLATAEILPHTPSAPAAAPHRAQLVPARIP